MSKKTWAVLAIAAATLPVRAELSAAGGLLAYLEATGGRYGLQTMCEGGGLANVTIVERL